MIMVYRDKGFDHAYRDNYFTIAGEKRPSEITKGHDVYPVLLHGFKHYSKSDGTLLKNTFNQHRNRKQALMFAVAVEQAFPSADEDLQVKE